MQCDVSVIGAAIIDVLAGPIDESIFKSGTLPMKTMGLSFGGDALNEAVILSQLGMNVELISKIGNDEAGKRILDFLKEKRVRTKIKVEDNLETGINIVLINQNGERTFLTNPAGSLRKLAEEDIVEHLDAAGDIICMASLFVSPVLDIRAMERVFKAAKSKPGRTIVADMTTAKNGESLSDIECLLQHIDYIIPNEIEVERLTGEKDVFRSANLFLEHGVSCVIIKRGAQGCLIKTHNQEIVIPAYAKANVLDTTGAGDSFVAGFVWGLKNGMSLEECGRFGCAVASCTVEKLGANVAIESIELPMKRYKEMLKAEGTDYEA